MAGIRVRRIPAIRFGKVVMRAGSIQGAAW
jgi:hypothetical protein